MATEVKFTEEEMKQLNELQQTYVGVQNSFGQAGVQRIRVEQQLTDLDSAEEQLRGKFVETQVAEKAFVDEIKKKYGDGNLNLETGVFTPAPPAPAKAETPTVGAPSAASAVETDKTL